MIYLFNFLQPFVFLFIFVSLFPLYVIFYYFCDIMVVAHLNLLLFVLSIDPSDVLP